MTAEGNKIIELIMDKTMVGTIPLPLQHKTDLKPFGSDKGVVFCSFILFCPQHELVHV